MLFLSDNRRYFLYQGSTDMRKSFDGLGGLVKQEMNISLLGGDIFIFINKRRNQIKLLSWDTDGFCVYHKRLEKGSLQLLHSLLSRMDKVFLVRFPFISLTIAESAVVIY